MRMMCWASSQAVKYHKKNLAIMLELGVMRFSVRGGGKVFMRGVQLHPRGLHQLQPRRWLHQPGYASTSARRKGLPQARFRSCLPALSFTTAKNKIKGTIKQNMETRVITTCD